MKYKPNPGTQAALDMGCICPVLDNAHGHGYMGQKNVFVYTVGCPVHYLKPIPEKKKQAKKRAKRKTKQSEPLPSPVPVRRKNSFCFNGEECRD